MTAPDEDDDSPRARPRQALLGQLRKLYLRVDATYAGFRCPASAECCQLAARKREPWLWPLEWTLLVDSLSAEHRTLPAERDDGACRFLDASGKRCTVYEHRPFGCRTFFCERATGLARQPAEQTDRLLRELESLSRELAPDEEPRPLTQWRGQAK